MIRAPRGAWSTLVLLSVAELMGMSLWFTASALSPELAAQWGLSEGQAGWLTTVVQLGFVAGTAVAAFLNLADIFPAARYFAISALLGAVVNAGVLVAPGYESALVLRFLTGFFLAGVYPPAMKMIATWFRDARGFAIGTIVGALTVGKAVPYLLTSVEGGGATLVLAGASLACAASGLLVLATYRDGPYGFERRPFSWQLAGTVLRHRETRLAIAGYLGHMWELYPMWAMITLFFGDYFAIGGGSALPGARLAGVAGFGAIAIGGVGAVMAGTWADRLGRERVTIWAMAVSGACAAAMGWLLAAPLWPGRGGRRRVGFLGGRRQRPVQRGGDGGGSPTCGRHGPHPPDLARLPPHRRDHLDDRRTRDPLRLARRLRRPCAGAVGGYRGDAAAAAAQSWRPAPLSVYPYPRQVRGPLPAILNT